MGAHRAGKFKNTRSATEKWRVFTLDVWGNSKDGYEVNDLSYSGYVDLPPDATDDEIIACLQAEGHVKKGIRRKFLSVDGDDGFISIDYKGKPELQLRSNESGHA